MKISELFEQRRCKRGISVAELSRRVGMEYWALRTSLKGEREIQADEFVNLCHELELSLDDFDNCSSVNASQPLQDTRETTERLINSV